MKLTFVLLGIVDLIAASMIFYPFHEAVLLYVMVYMLAKGGFFLFTGLASKSMGPHCILLCVSDLLVGVGLAVIALGLGSLSGTGIAALFPKTVGIIGLLKGIYTTVLPFLS